MTDTNNWNITLVSKLQEWQIKCEKYSRAHIVSKDKYENLFTYTIVPVILMGIMCSVFSTMAAIYTSNSMYAIISAICGALSTGLSFWIQNKNPTEIASMHEKIAQGYSGVALAIETELAQSPEDRIDGVRFLNSTSARMNNLFETGPTLSDEVLNPPQVQQPDLIEVKTDTKVVPAYEFRLDNMTTVTPDVVNRITDLQLDRNHDPRSRTRSVTPATGVDGTYKPRRPRARSITFPGGLIPYLGSSSLPSTMVLNGT